MGEDCCDEKCCNDSGCGCNEGCNCCSEETSKTAYMLKLADEAWSELMKEKMKAALEKMIGDKMNKAAQVSAEASMAYWANKMKNEAALAEFEEKLRKAMM